MEKILVFTFCLCLFLVGLCAEASSFAGIYDKYQVVYSPSANAWSVGAMAPDRIVLTKKTSSGSGSYSQYYNSKGKLAMSLGSNYEFISGKKLIAVHNADLKYFKVIYKNGKFSEVQLNEKELQAIFPDAQIIKISEFKNNKITVHKGKEGKTFLLLNDTDKQFYKYSYKPETVKKTDIVGLVDVNKMGKIKFSHYGEKTDLSPMYTIVVKK